MHSEPVGGYPEVVEKDAREALRISRRIDILKRMAIRHPHSFPKSTHSQDGNGTIRRIVPKKPSKYAIRKGTRRARLYAAFAHKQSLNFVMKGE